LFFSQIRRVTNPNVGAYLGAVDTKELRRVKRKVANIAIDGPGASRIAAYYRLAS
jgi:hypothetical protein